MTDYRAEIVQSMAKAAHGAEAGYRRDVAGMTVFFLIIAMLAFAALAWSGIQHGKKIDACEQAGGVFLHDRSTGRDHCVRRGVLIPWHAQQGGGND